MNFKEFIKTYDGKAIDYDGGYGVQCVDLIKLYLDKVFDIKIGAIGNAEAYFRRYDAIPLLKNNFIKITNIPSFKPKKGDIVVWDMKFSKTGHIAIADGVGTTSEFYSYDMNWNGKPMKRVKHNYKGVAGVLRPKDQSKINSYIKYEVHIQNLGWQTQKENGQIAGTEGQSLRIEAIKISAYESIRYRVHIQDKGWSEWVPNDCIAGTVGQSKRIEAIEIVTEGSKLKATAHIQDLGWQDAQIGNSIKIGTEGQALRLEALQLEFV